MSGAACPCCSGGPYEACCAPFLNGVRPAPTAEALMRSRFSAFVRGDGDYLLKTWHPDTRPSAEKPGGMGLDWLHLHMDETEAGGRQDESGVVAFTATFRDGRKVRRLHERSRFVRESGQWFYVDGECRIEEQGRNTPCFCGSGKKFKHCCMAVQHQQEASS